MPFKKCLLTPQGIWGFQKLGALFKLGLVISALAVYIKAPHFWKRAFQQMLNHTSKVLLSQ